MERQLSPVRRPNPALRSFHHSSPLVLAIHRKPAQKESQTDRPLTSLPSALGEETSFQAAMEEVEAQAPQGPCFVMPNPGRTAARPCATVGRPHGTDSAGVLPAAVRPRWHGDATNARAVGATWVHGDSRHEDVQHGLLGTSHLEPSG